MFLLLEVLEGQIFFVWWVMFFWTYRTIANRPYPFFWTNAIRPYKKKILYFYFGMDGGKIFFLPLLLFYIVLYCFLYVLYCLCKVAPDVQTLYHWLYHWLYHSLYHCLYQICTCELLKQ